ncbi:MAG TPA: molybdenum cofactor guanylyltransferase MobA [Aquabacterium sp.]|nr:molybdenum cofactor guanylyltransferase MobA [Aquabacterium sp.]
MVDSALPDLAHPAVSCWVLCGGLGTRMGGLDKGLQAYQGRPLVEWVVRCLRPQVGWLGISANRNQDRYQQGVDSDGVWPDETDLAPDSGPLAGIVTGMRHAPGDWLMVVPCDTPHLPENLVPLLLELACQDHLDAVTPVSTDADGLSRPHWVCSLIHKRVYPKLMDEFVKGERKVGRFIQSLRWSAVSFPEHSAFANLNTLESLNGHV